MEKKSVDKGKIILFSILGVLAAALITVAVIVIVKNTNSGKKEGSRRVSQAGISSESKNNSNSNSNSGTDEFESVFSNELNNDNGNDNSTGNQIYFVKDGFKFTVPADYSCLYSDGIGPVVYLEDVFQMKTGVADGSYSNALKNPENLTSKTVGIGGKILQDVKETKIDGRQYAYFIAEISGEKCMVAYTQSPDENKRIGGQLAMLSSAATEDDIIKAFAKIVSTAEITDEADSTKDDISEQLAKASHNYGEQKSESTISHKGTSVTFKVPEGFYSQGSEDTDSYGVENFSTSDYVTADCNLWDTESYQNASDYISNMASTAGSWDEKWSGNEVEVETETINGRTCYYYVSHYKYDDTDYQRVYAACDIDGSHFYSVKLSALDSDKNVNFDTIKDFFNIAK